MWTHALCHKSDTFNAFKMFKAAAERESGKRLCKVLTDNAQELVMGDMHTYCKLEGIMLHTTVPYHPALNGVAEWVIRILMNSVCAMLVNSRLLKSLWAEAFSMATYVQNRMPAKALNGCTSWEVVYGTPPNMSDLHAFGAPCAVVELAVKLRKLDNCLSMCFLVGYKYGGGGYRVWDPKRQVVIETCDVVFFEGGLPEPVLCEGILSADDRVPNVVVPFSIAPQAPEPLVTPPPLSIPAFIPPPTLISLPSVLPLCPAVLDDSLTRLVVTNVSPIEDIDIASPTKLVIHIPGAANCLPLPPPPLPPPLPLPLLDNEDLTVFGGLPHNVAAIPDFPVRSLCSGHVCSVEIADKPSEDLLQHGGVSLGGPVAFSAGLPGGIQLSNLPDPHSVCKAMASPDSDNWKVAMNNKMLNLKLHDVYNLVPHQPSMRTLRLGWVLHHKFQNGVFDKNKA